MLPLPPAPRTLAAVADYVLSVIASGAETPYIGEPMSQTAHALQCAALAATSTPAADDATVVAALLHDIGQFAPEADLQAVLAEFEFDGVHSMGSSNPAESVGRIGHETLGARFLLALGFPEKVARLVESHVAAKRYLCAVDAGYHGRLSDASKKSLEYQGGPMSEAEARAFAASPWCDDMCRLRKWDDGAKVLGLQVPDVDSWNPAVRRVLEANTVN